MARGALLADELETIANRLRTASAAAMKEVVERSVSDFAEGEALVDPLRRRQVVRVTSGRRSAGALIGAVAAFRRD
ncbi:MAG: hypothetical protein ACRD1K_14910 [Acidimicrobiales bacterium]